MAVQSPPFAMQNGSHSAALFRQAASSMLYQAGPINGSDYVVSAQPTPNMTVQVSAGQAWVHGTSVGNVTGTIFSTQGSYYVLNDGTVTMTIGTANATNPRIDIVCLGVTDSAYSGASNTGQLTVVAGAPAASPLPPAAPANAIVLAQVRVNANASSITNSNITPVTSGVGALGATLTGTMLFATLGNLPTGCRPGQIVHEYETGLLKWWTGAQWTAFAMNDTPNAWLYQSTTQSLAANTPTTVTLNSQNYDTASGHVGSGFTIPAGFGGLWRVEGGTVVTGIATSTFLASAIAINGTIYGGGWGTATPTITGSTQFSASLTGSRTYALAAGDVVTLQANVGAAGSTGINGAESSWMSLSMVGFATGY